MSWYRSNTVTETFGKQHDTRTSFIVVICKLRVFAYICNYRKDEVGAILMDDGDDNGNNDNDNEDDDDDKDVADDE